MQNEHYHNEKLTGTPEYYLVVDASSQNKTMDDIDATTCALNRAKGICGMLTTAFDGSEEYTFSNTDVSNSIWAIEGLIEQAVTITQGTNLQEHRSSSDKPTEAIKSHVENKHLMNVGFPSDYFIVNPKAPRTINIDVLNALVKNAETLTNVIIKNLSADDSVIDHKYIIEMAFMADDYLSQAVQVIKHVNQDGDIIDSLGSVISMLDIIQRNGECLVSGFTSPVIAIIKTMEIASKTLNETHKKMQSMPNRSNS